MKDAPETIQFNGRYTQCRARLQWGRYGNGRDALSLTSVEMDEPILTATVNLVGEDLPAGCTFIKNWSENEGVLQSLIEAGVVQPVGKVRTGHVEADLCRWLVHLPREM